MANHKWKVISPTKVKSWECEKCGITKYQYSDGFEYLDVRVDSPYYGQRLYERPDCIKI